MSLNSMTSVASRQVAELAGEARLVDRLAVVQPHHRLVDRAVIAAVEDEDLRPAGDGAGDAQREAVGVGRGGGDLPVRQAEALAPAAGREPARPRRAACRSGRGRPGGGWRARPAAANGRTSSRCRRGRNRRARLPSMSVIVAPFALLDHDREGRRPVVHPVHRHAAEEARDALAERSLRFRPRLAESDALGGAQLGDAGQRDTALAVLS